MITADEARELSRLQSDLAAIGRLIEARARDGFTFLEMANSSAFLRDSLREHGFTVKPILDAGHVYGHIIDWE